MHAIQTLVKGVILSLYPVNPRWLFYSLFELWRLHLNPKLIIWNNIYRAQNYCAADGDLFYFILQ